IRPSCCTTLPRNSPMAVSSASAPRSGSPPVASMPAARSGWSSSPASNTACAAAARSGRESHHLMFRLPPHAPGMRIGLFGGTFDPPHQAHRAACLIALARLRLDRVWWLVTPGNPLKDTRGLAPLGERIAAARALGRARIPETAANTLPDRVPPAWVYLHGLKSPLSSTALRAARRRS